MLQRQEEVSDVEVVLKEIPGGNAAALTELREHGLAVSEVNDADGVVEGTILADRVAELRRLACVSHVRDVMTYLANEDSDKPQGGH